MYRRETITQMQVNVQGIIPMFYKTQPEVIQTLKAWKIISLSPCLKQAQIPLSWRL